MNDKFYAHREVFSLSSSEGYTENGLFVPLGLIQRWIPSCPAENCEGLPRRVTRNCVYIDTQLTRGTPHPFSLPSNQRLHVGGNFVQSHHFPASLLLTAENKGITG